uniref:Uncharacterized protein n=1 Tax=Arundo donax TaxID=35708 RepID=A0A0A9DW63_ARUDO
MGWLVGWADLLSLLLSLFPCSSFFFPFSFPLPASVLLFLRLVWRRLASPYERLGVA